MMRFKKSLPLATAMTTNFTYTFTVSRNSCHSLASHADRAQSYVHESTNLFLWNCSLMADRNLKQSTHLWSAAATDDSSRLHRSAVSKSFVRESPVWWRWWAAIGADSRLGRHNLVVVVHVVAIMSSRCLLFHRISP